MSTELFKKSAELNRIVTKALRKSEDAFDTLAKAADALQVENDDFSDYGNDDLNETLEGAFEEGVKLAKKAGDTPIFCILGEYLGCEARFYFVGTENQVKARINRLI